MKMKKIIKGLLIVGVIDMFYGHFYAVWRNVSPETFDGFFVAKDMLYHVIGIDKIWKKKED